MFIWEKIFSFFFVELKMFPYKETCFVQVVFLAVFILVFFVSASVKKLVFKEGNKRRYRYHHLILKVPVSVAEKEIVVSCHLCLGFFLRKLIKVPLHIFLISTLFLEIITEITTIKQNNLPIQQINFKLFLEIGINKQTSSS